MRLGRFRKPRGRRPDSRADVRPSAIRRRSHRAGRWCCRDPHGSTARTIGLGWTRAMVWPIPGAATQMAHDIRTVSLGLQDYKLTPEALEANIDLRCDIEVAVQDPHRADRHERSLAPRGAASFTAVSGFSAECVAHPVPLSAKQEHRGDFAGGGWLQVPACRQGRGPRTPRTDRYRLELDCRSAGGPAAAPVAGSNFAHQAKFAKLLADDEP